MIAYVQYINEQKTKYLEYVASSILSDNCKSVSLVLPKSDYTTFCPGIGIKKILIYIKKRNL